MAYRLGSGIVGPKIAARLAKVVSVAVVEAGGYSGIEY